MDQDFISQTALDQMVISDRDQMLKASVPYLPPKGQQILSVYEKAKELVNTVSQYDGCRPDDTAYERPRKRGR